MLGLKLNHVSKSGQWSFISISSKRHNQASYTGDKESRWQISIHLNDFVMELVRRVNLVFKLLDEND